MSFANGFHNKVVWLSGSTGFKGSWLAEWLLGLGARVYGFALPPENSPSLFAQLDLQSRISQEFADIRDAGAVRSSIEHAQPDFVFHLAAQSIVRVSYEKPVDTYATNVIGTAHVLDALRSLQKPCATVFVTSDKCYENREWHYSYREDDPLGGLDPYSSSKAAAEIAISSWRRSFFRNHGVRIASARAGNVIGGGDWAKDRIVPDCIRTLQAGQAIPVRSPKSTRPWQHVLEALSGYLWLAACLAAPDSLLPADRPGLQSAFNFGPNRDANRTVGELVREVLKHWPGRWEDKSDPTAAAEAGILQLSSDKAHAILGWLPVWNFSTAVAQTVKWYREVATNFSAAGARDLTSAQISEYTAGARELGLAWATSR